MKKRVRFVRQSGETDCAAASLAMILSYYGKNLPLAQIRESVRVDQHGANIYGILSASEQYGLHPEALSGSAEAFRDEVDSGTISLPVIARIVNRHHFEHFIVITAVTQHQVSIVDPGEGRMTIPFALFQECFLGNIVKFCVTERFIPENRKQSIWKHFFHMAMHQKGLILSVSVLSMLITFIGMMSSVLFKILIDGRYEGGISLWGIDAFLSLAVLTGSLYLIRYAIQLLRGKLIAFMTKRVNTKLLLMYYDHAVDLPVSFYSRFRTGDLLSRFGDASKIQEAFSNVTVSLFIDVVMCVLSGAFMYRCSPALFSIAVILLAAYVLIILLFAPIIAKKNRQIMEYGSSLNSHLKETFDGIMTIKSHNGEDEAKSKTRSLLCKLQEKGMEMALCSINKESLIELLTSGSTVILLIVGSGLISAGTITLGSLISFHNLLTYFLTPVRNIVDMQSCIQEAAIASERLSDIADATTEQQSGKDYAINSGTEIAEAVEFNHVKFRYGNRKLVLNDLSFTIQKGQRVAFVGGSGSGKTTVTKLIMGFFMPETGNVRVNGSPVAEVLPSDLRNALAYVSQEVFLTASTIRENLMMGNNLKYSDDELLSVLDHCCCSFIHDLPFGLDTVLEENGKNLSGGQRQRLAIARALLRKPRILIMDEATSNLDSLCEYELLQNLNKIEPELTVIMTAHRLNTIRKCDHIYVLDQGKIIEEGTHDKLLEADSHYSKLWMRQNM